MTRDIGRRIDQQVRAQRQADQAQRQEQADFPPRHVRVGAFDILVFFGLILQPGGHGAPVVNGLTKRGTQHQAQCGQQRQPLHPSDDAPQSQHDEQHRCRQHLQIGFARITIAGRQTCQQGRRPQNQQDIGRVGPDNIAHGQTRNMVMNGLHGDQQLRRRGAKRNDGQRDDQGRNTQTQRQVHRAPHQRIARKQKDHQAQARIDQIQISALP